MVERKCRSNAPDWFGHKKHKKRKKVRTINHRRYGTGESCADFRRRGNRDTRIFSPQLYPVRGCRRLGNLRKFFLASSFPQIRITFQPLARRRRFTRRSRARLAEIFMRQKAALVLGLVPCLRQPCQKQPTTNTATWSRGKMKSGRTRPVERTRGWGLRSRVLGSGFRLLKLVP